MRAGMICLCHDCWGIYLRSIFFSSIPYPYPCLPVLLILDPCSHGKPPHLSLSSVHSQRRLRIVCFGAGFHPFTSYLRSFSHRDRFSSLLSSPRPPSSFRSSRGGFHFSLHLVSSPCCYCFTSSSPSVSFLSYRRNECRKLFAAPGSLRAHPRTAGRQGCRRGRQREALRLSHDRLRCSLGRRHHLEGLRTHH